jgi:hypothetical protein
MAIVKHLGNGLAIVLLKDLAFQHDSLCLLSCDAAPGSEARHDNAI